MEHFTTFMTWLLGVLSGFLASEPIIYFVALTVLLFIIRIFVSLVFERN